MVAVVLGMLTVGVLTTAYVQLSQSGTELGRANDQIENGRVAIQILENDLAHAGYWGGFVPAFDDLTQGVVPGDVPTTVPDPCLAYNMSNWDAAYKTNLLGIPIQVYDDQSIATATTCGSVVTDIQPNTDVLVVRHADTCVAGMGTCPAVVATGLYLQASFCSTDPAPTYVLDTANFTRHRRNCTDAADLRRFVSDIYYVRTYYVTAGDGIPTLVQSSFGLGPGGGLSHQPAQALIPGIAAFRIELGIDSLSRTSAAVDYSAAVAWSDPSTMKVPTNRGDGAPDGDYVRCSAASPCSVEQLRNAVAARIHVLAQALQPSTGYADLKTYHLGASSYGPYSGDAARYKRHVYTTTVRLNNVSGRRATP
jgi:type IV pilus assembly protein PilW